MIRNPDRYADAKARKNYSGMSPITRASGTKRVVLARFARNRRLGDAPLLQAFAALNNSPGARAFYDRPFDDGGLTPNSVSVTATPPRQATAQRVGPLTPFVGHSLRSGSQRRPVQQQAEADRREVLLLARH